MNYPETERTEFAVSALARKAAEQQLAYFYSQIPLIHHSDDLAVDMFAKEMKIKLAKARQKGRSGWDDPTQCTVEHLSNLFHDHVEKGDPIDVANFCMMLFKRDSNILTKN